MTRVKKIFLIVKDGKEIDRFWNKTNATKFIRDSEDKEELELKINYVVYNNIW